MEGYAPVVAHDDPNPVPFLHAQVQQPPCESLYVPVKLAKVPCEMGNDPKVVPEWASVRPCLLLASDEGGAGAMYPNDVVAKIRWQGLGNQRGLLGTRDFGQRQRAHSYERRCR